MIDFSFEKRRNFPFNPVTSSQIPLQTSPKVNKNNILNVFFKPVSVEIPVNSSYCFEKSLLCEREYKWVS
jgi:hypothetical protein